MSGGVRALPVPHDALILNWAVCQILDPERHGGKVVVLLVLLWWYGSGEVERESVAERGRRARQVRTVCGFEVTIAAIQQAIKLLGDPELEDAYTAAWQEWEDAGEAEAWAVTVADGAK